MSKRRRFGRVRQLPSGRWQARYLGPDARDHSAPETFATKTDADRWLSAFETDVARNGWVETGITDESFGEYAVWWLAHRPALKASTRELYDWLLTKYVVPELGKVAVAKMTPSLIRQWHADLSARAAVTPTRQAYSLVRAILSTAVTDGVIRRNPCTVAGATTAKAVERTIPTLAEVNAVAVALPARYTALVLTAAWSTARWGELTALTRDRLDLDAGLVRFNRQFVQLRHSKLIEDTPKSGAGVRTVHLPPHLIPVLRKHLAEHVADDCPLVFPNSKGQPVTRNSFRSVWVLARKKAGLPALRFHDLRHFGNTVAATAGASTKELMERAGHSTMQAALIYQHATVERQAAIAAAMSVIAEPPGPAAAALQGPRRAARRQRRGAASGLADQLTFPVEGEPA